MAVIFTHMFAAGTGFWDLGGGATQTIFQGGKLIHRGRAARAAFLQATEQYRSTVLTAFENVADTRNFEPMRKQVEKWQRSELTDVAAKLVIYEAFVEGKLEAPRHLARTGYPVLRTEV
jgi:hypothetical protein